jgi:hypothetical protein
MLYVYVCNLIDKNKKGVKGARRWREGAKTTLTRHRVDPPGQRGLVPPDALAQGLVPGADGHDGDQRDDEAQRGRDAPLAEDDAEVGRVPCEEHIHVAHGAAVAVAGVGRVIHHVVMVVGRVVHGGWMSWCSEYAKGGRGEDEAEKVWLR